MAAVLEAVAEAWDDKRDEIQAQGEKMVTLSKKENTTHHILVGKIIEMILVVSHFILCYLPRF